jgi:hypothetical protein
VGFSSKDNGDAINEGNLKGKILEYWYKFLWN